MTTHPGRLRLLARDMRRRVSSRRGATRAGRESVSIDSLVSPLRYDIVVRERFIEFFEENEALYDSDFEEFARRSRSHPYYVWFSRVSVPKFRPYLLAGDELLERAFEDRLHDTVALVRGFRETGPDGVTPILLRTGRRIEPTTSGKHVIRSLYATDGSHRLALLRRAGLRALAPAMYRVAVTRSFRPRDNTALLLESLAVSHDEYFAFLALGYGNGSCASEDALLEHVRQADPQRLAELQAVIAADSSLLRSTC